jgi:hypothetical protein
MTPVAIAPLRGEGRGPGRGALLEPVVLQNVTVVGSASCVTWANAKTLITEPALIPRISLIRLHEHLIRGHGRIVQERLSRVLVTGCAALYTPRSDHLNRGDTRDCQPGRRSGV